MSDRTRGFLVTLDHEMRVDDSESTIAAILHIKGVVSVEPVVSDANSHFAYTQARREIGEKIWAVLYPKAMTP